MPKDIITNTSCLIALEKIGQLKLLCKLYEKVLIPREVRDEFSDIKLPCLIDVQVKKEKKKFFIEELNLGKGEASVLALALESNQSCIIDDLKAKKIGIKMNLKVTGTISILLKAQNKGLIKSAYNEVKKLKDQGFYLSDDLLNEVKERKK